ncbi:MAG: efflux transporter outer membrane subunit [Acidobacteria bacterium]|nr:efflux transporter outer membrane subunit [Acidobacteriota bacterium]
MTRKVLLVPCALLLAACAPQKQTYKAPPPPVPETWNTGLPASEPAGAASPADLKWADFFLDDRLRQVVKLALDNNRNLRLAALNVEKAQALFRIQRARQFPTVNAGATGDAYRIPRDMTSNDKAYTYETMQIGVQVSSWEADLFGRIRSLKQQALEQYLATEQGRISTQLALVSEVATAYLALGADRDNLRLAQATLDAQKATYDLVRQTRDKGLKSDLEVSQSQSQVEAAQVDVVRFTGLLTLDENALTLLVGAPVPESLLPRELGPAEALKEVAAGLPSGVLLRRPDIVSAEHQLKAAYANIAAARAAFFPTIVLTGGGGITSSALSQLFSPRALTWQFAPQITVPIFDSGIRKTNYQVAELDRDAAVAQYEQAIQVAFREVSDALSQRGRLLEQQSAQQALVNTLGETYRLTEARYKAGVDNYLSVLVAQRSLYAAQQAMVGIRLSRLGNLVILYKVLGGGA